MQTYSVVMSKSQNWAAKERAEFVKVIREVGPDAPTLCAGWTAKDLAAHIVVRERRPDAAIGIMLPIASNYTDKVMARYCAMEWEELVSLVESGAPSWNPMSITAVDEVANVLEFFVHAEDVRRAQPHWTARTLDPEFSNVLWSRLSKMAKLQWRRAKLGVTLLHSDDAIIAKAISANGLGVTVEGEPSELVLKSYGRTECVTRVDGTPDSVAVYNTTNLHI